LEIWKGKSAGGWEVEQNRKREKKSKKKKQIEQNEKMGNNIKRTSKYELKT
jgi:hypothetical protein